MRPRLTFVFSLFIALLLIPACGGGGDDDDTDDDDATATTAPDDDDDDDESGDAIADLDGVRSATVRIVASGSFVDPDFGQQNNVAGSGSGFIITEDGIAITNNHVVTGAAFIEVFIGGDDEPHNARVLGVSECSDLAVIDIDGDGFPFLDWYEGEITTGLAIYAAGFPLGIEDYTLLDGIIARASADGETTWSSVDSVVEHTADTLPGNSGGPIVDSDGQVVAVNYAGDSAGRSFAIGRDEALEIIDQLREGEDVTSIGVNGAAVAGTDWTGVWVSSVESGSPAHEAGIRAGDIITRMEGLVLAADGTMADYCDILRSHLSSDPLSVEVWRSATLTVYEGTLNSSPLEEITSFANEVQDEVQDDTSDTIYNDYVDIEDDTGHLSMSVPAEWNDVRGAQWDFGGNLVGYTLIASPDINGWYDNWETPGVFLAASETLRSQYDSVALLDDDSNEFSNSCEYDGRYPYEDALYLGQYDLWVDCDGIGTVLVILTAEPADGSFVILLQAIAIFDADLDAIDTVLNTFVAEF
jgi:serine protease Do